MSQPTHPSHNHDDLRLGSFGVQNPISKIQALEPQKVEAVLAPGVVRNEMPNVHEHVETSTAGEGIKNPERSSKKPKAKKDITTDDLQTLRRGIENARTMVQRMQVDLLKDDESCVEGMLKRVDQGLRQAYDATRYLRVDASGRLVELWNETL